MICIWLFQQQRKSAPQACNFNSKAKEAHLQSAMDMVATAMKADSQEHQAKGKGRLRSKKSGKMLLHSKGRYCYAIQKQFQAVGTFQNCITGKKDLGKKKKKFRSFQAISII